MAKEPRQLPLTVWIEGIIDTFTNAGDSGAWWQLHPQKGCVEKFCFWRFPPGQADHRCRDVNAKHVVDAVSAQHCQQSWRRTQRKIVVPGIVNVREVLLVVIHRL